MIAMSRASIEAARAASAWRLAELEVLAERAANAGAPWAEAEAEAAALREAIVELELAARTCEPDDAERLAELLDR
jgi:hypothetical protein